jgi:AsmA protein
VVVHQPEVGRIELGGRDITDLSGVTVPVRVSGPLDSPSYKLDFASMVTDAAKQQVQERVTSEIGKRLGGVAGPSAVQHARGIGGDTVKPGREFRIRAEAAKTPVDAQESILQYLLGIRLVSSQAAC